MPLNVEQQTLITAKLDASAYPASAKQIADANTRMAASGDSVTTSSTKMTRALLDGAGVYERYARQLDTSYAAAAKLQKAQDDLARAVRNGWTTQDQANQILAVAYQRYGQVTVAAQRAAEATQKIASAQGAYNAFARVTPAAYGQDLAKRGADIAAYGAALDRVKASFNPLFAAQQGYQAQLGRINEAERNGAIITREADVARTRATESLNRAIAANRAYAESLDAAGTAAARMQPNSQAAFNAYAGVKAPLYGNELSNRQADLDAYGSALDALRASLSPAAAAQQAYEAQLAKVSQALRVGAISEAEASAARADAAITLRAAKDANEALASSIERVSTVNRAGNSQAAFNAYAGVKAPTGPDDLKAREADLEAYGAELDRLRAKYNPLFAVSKQYEATLNEISHAQKVGALSAHEAEVAMERAGEAMAEAGPRVEKGGEGFDKGRIYTAGLTRELIVLGHEVIVGNYSRIPGSILVLGERLGNLGNIAKGLGALVTSPFGLIGLGAAAATAALTVMAVSAEKTARRIIDLQNALRATNEDFVGAAAAANQAAKDIARTTSIDTPDARAATQTLASSPAFRGSEADMKALTLTAQNMSLVLGGTIPENVTKLTAAMGDAGKAAEAEVGKLRGFTAQFAASIADQEAAGDRAGAFARYLEAMRKATDGANTSLTPLQQAVHNLSVELTTASQHGHSFADSIGTVVTGALASVIQGLTDIIGLVRQVREMGDDAARRGGVQAPSFGQALSTALNPVGTLFGIHPLDALHRWLTPSPPVLSTVQPSIAPDLQRAAADSRLDPEFVARVQAAEGVFKNGQWQQSPTGAIGPMQVTATTARGMQAQPNMFPGAAGLDVNKPSDNLQLGTQLLAFLVKKYDGDLTRAVLAYHDGETKIDKVYAGGGNVSPSQEALTEARRVLGGYTGTGYANPLHPTLSPAAGYAAASGRSNAQVTTNQGVVNNPQTTLDRAYQDYLGANTVERQRVVNEQAQSRQQAAIDILTKQAQAAQGSGDTKGLADINIALQHARDLLAKLKGEWNEILTPQQQSARTLQDALVPLQAQVGAARELAQIDEKYAILARSTGRPDTASLNAEKAAKMQEFTIAVNDNIRAMDLQTTMQTNLTSAIEVGGATLDHATNYQKAQIDALKTAVIGTQQYTAQVIALTAASDREAAAKRTNAAASNVSNLNDEIELIQRETQLLTASVDVRTRELAVLRARQALQLDSGETASPEQQKVLDLTGRAADSETALRKAGENLNALQEIGTKAFDTIGSAFESMLDRSATAGQAFKSIFSDLLKEIISEFTKLAIINPILNSLFPSSQQRPTLGGVSDAASSLWSGGGAGADTSGGSSGGGGGGIGSLFSHAGGLIGSGVDAIGGKGFYQGGGLIGSWFSGSGAGSGLPSSSDLAALSAQASGDISAGAALHDGGLVGTDVSFYRNVPSWVFDTAPRYHSGLDNDEFAAILQRGERVLTANQNVQLENQLKAPAAQGGSNVVMNISTPDADSFKRSQPQIQARASAGLTRTAARSR